jgi:hypothetical protein
VVLMADEPTDASMDRPGDMDGEPMPDSDCFEREQQLAKRLLESDINDAFVCGVAAGDSLVVQTGRDQDAPVDTDDRRVILGKLIDNVATRERIDAEQLARESIEAYHAVDRAERMLDSFNRPDE